MRVGRWRPWALWFYSAPEFALGCVYICGEYAVGNSSNTKAFNGSHNEVKVSRGVGSRKQANEEKRVVSMRHLHLLHIMATELWNLVGISIVLLVPC